MPKSALFSSKNAAIKLLNIKRDWLLHKFELIFSFEMKLLQFIFNQTILSLGLEIK